MSLTPTPQNLRILVVDDNRSIHDDFRKILCAPQESELDSVEAALFDTTNPHAKRPLFQIDSGFQGQEGYALAKKAQEEGKPYPVAFVDVRMPPGWDGVETAAKIWEVSPEMQIVICTAYSDYSWNEMASKLTHPDRLVILKKPFDTVEVLQLAHALTEKWRLLQEVKSKMDHLETLVAQRTAVLQKEMAERQQQAALLDLASDAIIVRDIDGRIRFWNKGAETLYGWTSAEAVGTPLTAIFSKAEAHPLKAAEQELTAHGDWSGELKKHNKAGADVIVSSRWTMVRDEQGKPKSVLMINTDITEKKKLEAQFLRAQRMEGIGTLATGMAHDLNNILAPILMSAGTLRWKMSAQDRELAISRIETSVKRGAAIIQQVLTFGRGINGDRVAIHTSEIIEEVGKIVGQTFPKDVTVGTEIDAGLWPIVGDRTQIHQVLLNLCVNARDAMPKGGRLTVVARNLMLPEPKQGLPTPAQPGPYVCLSVTDTGCGIAPADRERIFDPFFTTKEVGKGTGLGLSTVLGIVKSHRGMVNVLSELQRGTTFEVLLPASAEAVKRSAPRVASKLPRGGGEMVLIVDDEPDIICGMRDILESQNYRVQVAKNGHEALEALKSAGHGIDVVVTDLMMPHMDGIAFMRGLRAFNPDLKIIASSGLSTDMSGRSRSPDLEELGVKAFLSKPYTADKLLVALFEALHSEDESANDSAREELAALPRSA